MDLLERRKIKDHGADGDCLGFRDEGSMIRIFIVEEGFVFSGPKVDHKHRLRRVSRWVRKYLLPAAHSLSVSMDNFDLPMIVFRVRTAKEEH